MSKITHRDHEFHHEGPHAGKLRTHENDRGNEQQIEGLNRLNDEFNELGMYADKIYGNKVMVFVGKSPHNPIGWMVFHYDGLVTASSSIGDKHSGEVHTNVVADDRKAGKKIAIKDAVNNDCIDITDEYGYVVAKHVWKLHTSLDDLLHEAAEKHTKVTQKSIKQTLENK